MQISNYYYMCYSVSGDGHIALEASILGGEPLFIAWNTQNDPSHIQIYVGIEAADGSMFSCANTNVQTLNYAVFDIFN